jgi:hypothetical protein
MDLQISVELLQNADAIYSGIPPNNLTQADALRYRDVVYSRLRSQVMSTRCASPLCQEQADRKLNWAMCDNCMLWHPAVCEGVTLPGPVQWYCSTCVAARQARRK